MCNCVVAELNPRKNRRIHVCLAPTPGSAGACSGSRPVGSAASNRRRWHKNDEDASSAAPGRRRRTSGLTGRWRSPTNEDLDDLGFESVEIFTSLSGFDAGRFESLCHHQLYTVVSGGSALPPARRRVQKAARTRRKNRRNRERDLRGSAVELSILTRTW
jgi:hypothetical protein